MDGRRWRKAVVAGDRPSSVEDFRRLETMLHLPGMATVAAGGGLSSAEDFRRLWRTSRAQGGVGRSGTTAYRPEATFMAIPIRAC